jgi:membrane-associated phospholipid phosphatase
MVFFAFIGIEFSYRQILFDKSLDWINSFQASDSSNSTKIFFKAMTILGTESVLIPLFVIIFNWLPLSKSYLFLTVLILSTYLDNVLKIIYNNPRPYWVRQFTFVSCEGGYGNPSGHAFSSASVYLTICHLTSDYEFFTKRKWLRVIYFIFFFLLIFTIILSRFYLGVHTLNQLIYGFLLGVCLYAFFFLALEEHKLDYNSFFEKFSCLKSNLIYWGLYLASFVLLLFLYFFLKTDHTYEQWLNSSCPDLAKYRKFENEGFYLGLIIFTLIGAHGGLNLLIILVDKYYNNQAILEYIHDWTYTSFSKSLLRLLFLALIGIPTLLPAVLVSKEADLAIIFIFKTAIPLFVTLLSLFSLGIFFSYKFHLTKNNFNISVPIEQVSDKENECSANEVKVIP